MISIPYEVANMIQRYHIHPVKAWRKYVNISKEELAGYLEVNKEIVDKIESSNLHLEKLLLTKLSNIFRIVPDAIKIRYNSDATSFSNSVFFSFNN